jgi:hypothetical protein
MLTDAAQTYSTVFAPELFVLLCGLFLIGYEWRGSETASSTGFGARIAVLGVGWLVAFAVYQGVPQLVDTLPERGSDVTASIGLSVGIMVIWVIWRLRDWGTVTSGFAALIVGVTIPHLLITPVWDISGHVLYAMTPAGYLFLIDRRFVPLLVVGLGMVIARPLAGAHTWPQSLGGFALAGAFLVAASRVYSTTLWIYITA